MTRPGAVITLLIVQIICASVFLWDLIATILGLKAVPLSWQLRELLELGASLGLIIGMILGVMMLKQALSRTRHVESQLRAASGAFAELLDERFRDWGLTPAEYDVAFFAIKGLSLQEISALRETSEGTVKAQTNAIYRKAGVSGRAQLLSLFVEDLLAEPVISEQQIQVSRSTP